MREHAEDTPSSQIRSSRPGSPRRLLRRLWDEGRPPDLAALAALVGGLAAAEAASLLCLEQWERWRSGGRTSAEAYLALHPDLADDREAAFDLIYGEFHVREELGESPTAEEYLARFPGHSGAIRRQVELRRVLDLSRPREVRGMKSRGRRAGRGRARGWPVIPGYEILGELGRGGMGVVYKAIQVGLNRPVALKMIPAGVLASPRLVDRFRAEAEAVARLHHPNIVQIYEVGEDGGRPYYAMELVEGSTLAERTAGATTPPRRAAMLVETLAWAIHSAHCRGIVHRDLKPANVLLTADGVPKVADFGLAKRLDDDARLQADSLVGTPSYMAPEQASGAGAAVGPPADVYALGGILYELLTGRPAFRGETPMETLRRVVSEEPPPPGRWQAGIPRDLETICLKCLRKDPSRRYATAEGLAEDLGRFLASRPIRARRTPLLGRVGRWCRREPAVATLIASVTFLLLVLASGASVAAIWLRQGRDEAVEARRDATEELWKSYLAEARADRTSGLAGRRFKAITAIEKAAGIRATASLRDEAIASMALSDIRPLGQGPWGPPGWTVKGMEGRLRIFAIGDEGGALSLRLVDGRAEVARLDDPNGRCWYVKFSPDGLFVAPRYSPPVGDDPRRFRVWESRTGRVVLEGPAGLECGDFDFSPDGRRLAVALPDGAISVYDIGSGREDSRLAPGLTPYSLAFRPDGEALAVSGRDAGAIEIRDARSGRVIRTLGPAFGVRDVSWRPDGTVLAAACGDSSLRLWNPATGELHSTLVGHKADAVHLTFNHRGDALASASWDGTVRLWDPSTGGVIVSLADASWPIQFSEDDRAVAVASSGPNAGLWEVVAGGCRTLPAQSTAGRGPWSVDYSPDGRLLAGATDEGVRLWSSETGEWEADLAMRGCRSAAFDPGDGRLVAIGGDGLHRWPIGEEGGRPRVGRPETWPSPVPGEPAPRFCPYPGGRIAVADSGAGRVLLVDPDRPAELVTLPGFPMASIVAASPDGRWIAVGARNGRGVRVRDARSGTIVLEWAEGDPQVSFSPDGLWFVAGTATTYKLWRAGTWEPGPSIPRETRTLRGPVAFSRDGRIMAILRSPGKIQLVEPATGRILETLTAPDPMIVSWIAFRPDGRQLAVATHNRAVQLWDLHLIRRQLNAIGLDRRDEPEQSDN